MACCLFGINADFPSIRPNKMTFNWYSSKISNVFVQNKHAKCFKRQWFHKVVNMAVRLNLFRSISKHRPHRVIWALGLMINIYLQLSKLKPFRADSCSPNIIVPWTTTIRCSQINMGAPPRQHCILGIWHIYYGCFGDNVRPRLIMKCLAPRIDGHLC